MERLHIDMLLYCNALEESLLWKNPRVSLETLFDAILEQQPRHIKKSFKNSERIRYP